MVDEEGVGLECVCWLQVDDGGMGADLREALGMLDGGYEVGPLDGEQQFSP